MTSSICVTVSIVKQSMQTRYLGSIASCVHLVHPRNMQQTCLHDFPNHMLLALPMGKSPAHWKLAHLEEDPDEPNMVTNTVAWTYAEMFAGVLWIYIFQTIHVWYRYITYMYHKDQPNVGKYTIHGWYGYWRAIGSIVTSYLDISVHCIDHWKSTSDSVTSSRIYGIDEFVWLSDCWIKISTHYPKCFVSHVLFVSFKSGSLQIESVGLVSRHSLARASKRFNSCETKKG